MNNNVNSDQVPTLTFKSDITGERYSLALYCERYNYGGGLAVGAIDISENDEDFGEEWGMLTVNLPDDPVAVSWCAQEGHVIIDTNNNSKALMDSLVNTGMIEFTGESVRSGFCTYPLATITPQVLGALRSYKETSEQILAGVHEVESQPLCEEKSTSVSLKGEVEAMRDSASHLAGGNGQSNPEPVR